MKTYLKNGYCLFKKMLGIADDDHWDNNPFVVL